MTRYALLVGINGYPKESGLAPLRFAERDAAELGKVLESRCGFKTRTLLGRQATTVAVQEALHESARGDTFLFFFAGHGQEIKGQYCLHPVDSKATGVNSIPFETFARHWEYDFGFNKVLAIIDACRNEFNWSQTGTRGAARGFQSSRDIEMATRNNRLVEVLYGCSDLEVSYEDEDLGHGVFTDSLLKVIHGYEGELDSYTLSNKANDLMRAWCQRDGHGKIQRAKRYYEPSEQHRIVLLEGARRQVTGEAEPQMVNCPLCGKYNTLTGTFECRQCRQNHLCLTHQDPVEFLCTGCLKQNKAPEPEPRIKVVEPMSAKSATPQGGDILTEPLTGMELVYVPGGRFLMGSPETEKGRCENEGPQHQVTVPGFWMGKYPVTQGEWKKVMWRNPSRNKRWFKDNICHPVEQVSWKHCQGYIKKLNQQSGSRYRLPSEAEWEYACRAGSTTSFSFSETISTEHACYFVSAPTRPKETKPVGSYPANDFGLHDMHGNVFEWCQDRMHKDYSEAPVNGSAWESGEDVCRVIRGGGFTSSPVHVRAAYRGRETPDSRGEMLGFRLVLSV